MCERSNFSAPLPTSIIVFEDLGLHSTQLPTLVDRPLKHPLKPPLLSFWLTPSRVQSPPIIQHHWDFESAPSYFLCSLTPIMSSLPSLCPWLKFHSPLLARWVEYILNNFVTLFITGTHTWQNPYPGKIWLCLLCTHPHAVQRGWRKIHSPADWSCTKFMTMNLRWTLSAARQSCYISLATCSPFSLSPFSSTSNISPTTLS